MIEALVARVDPDDIKEVLDAHLASDRVYIEVTTDNLYALKTHVVNAGIVFPRIAGIIFPRSSVLGLSSGLLWVLGKIVEHTGLALLA